MSVPVLLEDLTSLITILSFPIVATFQIITILSFPIVATFNQLFACTALVLPSRCSSYFRRALIHRKFTFHSVFVDSILNIPLPFNSQLINETAFFESLGFCFEISEELLAKACSNQKNLM